jgi:hypothetical protein
MARQSENLQPSLFEEDQPRIEVSSAQRADLAMLVEALLREIAITLASGELRDDQDHV